MALNLFPTTNTIAWSVVKSPNWATRLQRAVSGRELRVQDYTLPLYTFTLTYEILRDRWDVRGGFYTGLAYPHGALAPIYDELRMIWNFYNQQMGAFIPFAFFDVTDNTTRGTPTIPQTAFFGTGDGVTQSFQMASALLAPTIPLVINSVTPAYAYTFDSNTGVITFAIAPGIGVSVGADYTYFYKVRFASDGLEAENFMYQLWSMKQLKLVSVLEGTITTGVPLITFTPADPDIPDTTPVGTVVATFLVSMTDGSTFLGTVAFGFPNFDAGGLFIITGPASGPGQYNLVLNAPLTSPAFITDVTIVATP